MASQTIHKKPRGELYHPTDGGSVPELMKVLSKMKTGKEFKTFLPNIKNKLCKNLIGNPTCEFRHYDPIKDIEGKVCKLNGLPIGIITITYKGREGFIPTDKGYDEAVYELGVKTTKIRRTKWTAMN